MNVSLLEKLAPNRLGGEAYRVPAVVLGLGPTGLGVVRSLASRRVPVVGLYQKHRRTPYSHTRLCKKVAIDSTSREDLWQALLDLPVVSDRPVLFLTSDLDVLEASKHRRELNQSFRFHLPPHEQVQMLMHKTAFAEFAAVHRLPVPRTLIVEAGRGWDRVLDECEFPCIVKPKYRSVGWSRAGFSKTFVAGSRDELMGLISALNTVEGDFVIQEWIPGPDSNVFFHLAYRGDDGGAIASFTGRKVRQWAPLSGSTSMAEPARSPDVQELADRLFGLAGLRGLGSVEFKRDPRDGTFKITEPTVGRPNLQSEVATANGVNIAFRAYCDLAQADPGTTVTTPTRKVRWVFIERDIRSSLYYVRRKELTLREILRSYRGPRYYAEFSWHDPMPAVMRLAQILRGSLENRFARGSRKESRGALRDDNRHRWAIAKRSDPDHRAGET